jgi:tRNA threonylcarbamoyladenosine biosynthesis protein TsaE
VNDLTIVTRSAAATRAVGEAIGQLLQPRDIVLLAGDLGAGKTELTKGIGAALGVDDVIVSPTFTLARRYPGRVPLVHVDLYRLDRVQELLDLGLEEEGEDAVVVVEWGDVASAHLPSERLEVRISSPAPDADDPDERTITVMLRGPVWLAREVDLALALERTA